MKKNVVFFIVVLSIIFACKGEEHIIRKGNKIVGKIEKYKKISGVLPKDLNDLNLEEGPYYYNRYDSLYEVYYSISFDESLVYDSKLGKWRKSYQ
ncbi:MAG TPA: hypothetical protein VKX34_10480 [Aequorivita sp.]|nr:hypothetical protein [Aequorivita sp.]